MTLPACLLVVTPRPERTSLSVGSGISNKGSTCLLVAFFPLAVARFNVMTGTSKVAFIAAPQCVVFLFVRFVEVRRRGTRVVLVVLVVAASAVKNETTESCCWVLRTLSESIEMFSSFPMFCRIFGVGVFCGVVLWGWSVLLPPASAIQFRITLLCLIFDVWVFGCHFFFFYERIYLVGLFAGSPPLILLSRARTYQPSRLLIFPSTAPSLTRLEHNSVKSGMSRESHPHQPLLSPSFFYFSDDPINVFQTTPLFL